MQQFLRKVVLYLIPLVIVAVVFEISLRQLDNPYKFKKAYLDKHAQELETLVLGSSHAYYDINPKYIDQIAFNAGAVSQSLDLDLAILKRYEHKFNDLKHIVLPVSYFTFYGELSKSPEKWRMKDYVLYLDLNVPSSLRDHFEILNVKPKNNLKKLIRYYSGENVIHYSKTGWGNNYKGIGLYTLEKTGEEAALRHSEQNLNSEDSESKFKNGVAQLRSIVEWANKRNVKVLLFMPPAYHSYTSHLNGQQLEQVTAQLNSISNEFSNCEYINLLNNKNFIAEDYYDADHLNHKGAKKITLLINSLLR